MNDELILILDSFRNYSVKDGSCRGDIFNLTGTLTNPWKCKSQCGVCPLLQVRHPSAYSDQIIQTFSQLNK